MSIDTKKGVPGVPLAALDSIQDENTRQVLRAIVDGWHVRNGSSGDGKSRFITAAELGDLSGQVGGMRMLVGQVQQDQSKPKTAAEIRRIITDLEASVMESILFKELGDRITLIDVTAAQNLADGLLNEATARQAAITNEQTIRQAADTSLASQITTVTAAVNQNAAAIQNEATARVAGDTAEAQARQILAARVGAAEGAIVNEQTARTNADNAIVSQVNTQFATVNGNLSALQTSQTTTANNVAALSQSVGTLQVQVGNNTVALQAESTVRANTDNDIYAKYSVKIDNNGYVTGFGLISTSNNSTPFSEFIVRADRFAIGSPTGPGITPTVPFIVLTTPDADGNQPGVYMRNAMIANAAIGTAQIDDLAVNTAKIQDLAVDTLKIAGGSVTTMTLTEGANDSVAYGTWKMDAVVKSITLPAGASGVVVLVTLNAIGTTGTTMRLEIGTNGGRTVSSTAVSVLNGQTSSFVFMAVDEYPAVNPTYWANISNEGPSSGGTIAYSALKMAITGGKR